MDNNTLSGFKAFNNDLTTRYGQKLQIGVPYTVDGPVSFGNYGNGFHFTTYIEDCFRYFDNKNSVVCEVVGSGKIIMFDDDYYGYHDMAVSSCIEVIRVIPKDEILNTVINLPFHRRIKFLRTYQLSKEEILLYEDCFDTMSEKCYLEYQENSKYYVKK